LSNTAHFMSVSTITVRVLTVQCAFDLVLGSTMFSNLGYS